MGLPLWRAEVGHMTDRDQLAALIRPHLGGAPGTLSGQWGDRVAQEIAADVEASGWAAPEHQHKFDHWVRVDWDREDPVCECGWPLNLGSTPDPPA